VSSIHIAEPSKAGPSDRKWRHPVWFRWTKVVDPVDEPAEHISAEESVVARLGPYRKLIIEVLGERSGFFAVLRHGTSVALDLGGGGQNERVERLRFYVGVTGPTS
jgi:hypothetical protein